MLLVEVLHDRALEAATDVLGEIAELTVVLAPPPLEGTERGHFVLDPQQEVIGVTPSVRPIHQAEHFSESDIIIMTIIK
jgi:hypothetical protein